MIKNNSVFGDLAPIFDGSRDNTPEAVRRFNEATGPVELKFTNDFLFRVVFQRNKAALAGLIRSMLHLKPEDILSIEITNPILIGSFISIKTFVLDIRVLLNNSILINFEMQVNNEGNWPERSLAYASRMFSQITKGSDYKEISSVYQIGFLDYDLPNMKPEFCASIFPMNQKTKKIYSDKFRILVIELNHIELATKKDRFYHIDEWVRLFKATTWEEIKMLAEKNESIRQAAITFHEASADRALREFYEACEEALFLEQLRNKQLAEQEKALKENEKLLKQQSDELQLQSDKLQQQRDKLKQQSNELQQQNDKLKQQSNELQQQNNKLKQQSDELQQQSNKLKRQSDELQQQNNKIQEQDNALQQQNNRLQQKDEEIARLKAEIAALKAAAF